MYGPELIIDLFECNVSTFNRKSLRDFGRALCKVIGMTPEKFVSWDDDGVALEECQTEPKRKGHTAVQFLMESDIRTHTLELRKEVFVNIFSCKDFDRYRAKKFTQDWFGAKRATSRRIIRG